MNTIKTQVLHLASSYVFPRDRRIMKLLLFFAVVAFSAHFVAGETDIKPEEHNIAKRAVRWVSLGS